MMKQYDQGTILHIAVNIESLAKIIKNRLIVTHFFLQELLLNDVPTGNAMIKLSTVSLFRGGPTSR